MSDFRSGKSWSQIRTQVLLEEPRCSSCGESSEIVSWIHHMPQWPHYDRHRENVAAYCRPCNRRINQWWLPGRFRRIRTQPTTKLKW